MVAYTFRPIFADAILAGTKVQTIRGAEHFDFARDRKPGHAYPGQTMELFVTAHLDGPRLIARSPCVAVHPVTLFLAGEQEGFSCDWSDSNPDPRYAAAAVHRRECNIFAERDGFDSWAELVSFWHGQFPGLERFDGVLVRWAPVQP
jgi:hypothetical protein